MARLLTATLFLLVGLVTAASQSDDFICRAPPRYRIDMYNVISDTSYFMEMDFRNKVAVQTHADVHNEVEIVLFFQQGIRRIVSPDGCEDSAFPLLMFLPMAVVRGSEILGREINENGNGITGYRQEIVPSVFQEIYVEDANCFPVRERIIVYGNVVVQAVYSNLIVKTDNATIPAASGCTTL